MTDVEAWCVANRQWGRELNMAHLDFLMAKTKDWSEYRFYKECKEKYER